MKNLGLVMDQNLNYSKHVSNLNKSAYLALKSLYHLKDYLPKAAKLKLCDALVLSRLNYCDVVYGPCLRVEDINRLQKVQNSCVRYSLQIPRRQHISPHLKQIGWLNMRQRRWLHLCCLLFKVINTQQPNYLCEKLEFRSSAHSVQLRHCEETISVPIHSSEFFKRCFSYQASRIYNQISSELKHLCPASLRKRLSELILSGGFIIDF